MKREKNLLLFLFRSHSVLYIFGHLFRFHSEPSNNNNSKLFIFSFQLGSQLLEANQTLPNENKRKIDLTSICVFDLNAEHNAQEAYLKDIISTTALNMNGAGSLAGLLKQQGSNQPILVTIPQVQPPTIITFNAPPMNTYGPYNSYGPQQPGYGNFQLLLFTQIVFFFLQD